MAPKSASLTAALGNSLCQRFGRMLIMKASENVKIDFLDYNASHLLIFWITMLLIKIVSAVFI